MLNNKLKTFLDPDPDSDHLHHLMGPNLGNFFMQISPLGFA